MLEKRGICAINCEIIVVNSFVPTTMEWSLTYDRTGTKKSKPAKKSLCPRDNVIVPKRKYKMDCKANILG